MARIKKSDHEWQSLLSLLAYKVTRKHGTERAFSHDDFPKQISLIVEPVGPRSPSRPRVQRLAHLKIIVGFHRAQKCIVKHVKHTLGMYFQMVLPQPDCVTA